MEETGSLADLAIKTFAAEVDRLVPGGIMVASFDPPTRPLYHSGNQSARVDIRIPRGKHPYNATGFTLAAMPGCCGVLVSTSSFVQEEWRGRGIGTFMQSIKEWIAREFQVGCLLATVVKGNQPEEKLLRKTGWNPVSEFVNPKTGNTINVWKKEL